MTRVRFVLDVRRHPSNDAVEDLDLFGVIWPRSNPRLDGHFVVLLDFFLHPVE